MQANGKIYNNEREVIGDGEEFGPLFEEKQIMGCGYIADKKEVFFTKNGVYLGVAFKNVSIPPCGFFPAVCIQSQNQSVQANFGVNKFVFDIEGFQQREGLENFFDICAIPFDRSSLHTLVKSYLVHYAYVETLQAYEDEQKFPPEQPVEKKDVEMNNESNPIEVELSKEYNRFPGLTQTNFGATERPPMERKMTEDYKQVTFGDKESEEQIIVSVEAEENQESAIAKKYISDLMSK